MPIEWAIALFGVPLMKFTLTYDGELPSSGNGSKKLEKKWEIRKHFHPQLVELWNVKPALKQLQKHGCTMIKGKARVFVFEP